MGGAVAGIVAALITAATSGTWRGISLGVEAMLVGGALAYAATVAHRTRSAGAPLRLDVPLATPRGAGLR